MGSKGKKRGNRLAKKKARKAKQSQSLEKDNYGTKIGRNSYSTK